ncbi:TolC family protein [Prolixibacteraceae bacterium]|nr:TolC family protein [Prolixibacteraceae bacterium]
MKARLLKTSLMCLLLSNFANAETITLEACRSWSHEVFPIFKSQSIFTSILNNEMSLVKYDKYPSVILRGQVSYQSDVVSMGEPSSSFSFPDLSKDQYQLFVELNQNIYEGGVRQLQTEINTLNDSIRHLDYEMELHRLDQKVEQVYCQILFSKQQYLLHQQQVRTMDIVLSDISAQVKQGKAIRLQENEIKVQRLVCIQQQDQALQEYCTSCNVLSVLCGKVFDPKHDGFSFPIITLNNSNNTPNDILMMSLQQSKYLRQSEIIGKSLIPKINAFGKGGYGRPGLNFLDNSFNPYYYVGVGITWKPFDWKNTQRKRSLQLAQIELIEVKKSQKELLREARLKEMKGRLFMIEDQIVKDHEIIELRKEITEDLQKQWKQRTIPFSIYVDGMNNTLEAEISKELHRIQKLKTIFSYNRFLKQS